MAYASVVSRMGSFALKKSLNKKFSGSRGSILCGALLAGSIAGGGLACVGDAPAFAPPPEYDAATVEKTPEELARATFEADVAPLLTSSCSSCHLVDSLASAFMGDGAAGMYKAILEWPSLVSFRAPSASSLLIRGAHAGPAWKADQATTVQAWIESEAVIHPPTDTLIQTTPKAFVLGDNTVNLVDVGLAGASISFRAEATLNGFYLSLLTVNAGAKNIHLVHPTFVSWNGDTPTPDSVDRFSSIDLFAAAADSVSLGGGTAILLGPDQTTPMSIRFSVAEEVDSGSTVLVGCNAIDSFTANAQAMLQASCAAECHAGTRNDATNATDMTKMADLTPEGQAAACGQILSRVSLGDANNSSIFLAPQPGSALGHAFKLPDSTSFTAFRNSLNIWITAENATAP